MINIIKEELRKFDKRYGNRYIGNYENAIIVYLIQLKYLCDNGEYKYDEVIDSNSLYELNKQ